ncbi:hypothetical protein Tco_1018102 [Tanacetum coccineum]|uniref:Uncharacterized protein n=1 Tax=Tanacetum coccineum TaxID=301880 RepID=A0ABQ5FW03_9ASTR
MATMVENVIATGFETHPLMLEKGMYDSWETRIILYIRGKENSEMLKDSIDNGPYQFKPEITIKDTDGVTKIRRPQRLEDLAGEDKTQATIQNGHVTVQNVQGRQSQGYAGNAGNNQASGARVTNTVGNTGANQPRDKMLLAQAQEAGVILNDEQQDFLADSLEETDDYEDLQLQATTNFKVDHVDEYDLDCDEEATTNAIFMANLSPVGSHNDDTVKPCYDSDIPYKVPYYDTYHDSGMLNPNIQELGYIENIVSNNESLDEHKAGSENCPPMLNKENYVPWSSRLLHYAKSRPNGKLIYNSIMNGPYVRRMIPEPGDPARTVPVPETFHEQTDDELTEAKVKQIEVDDQAIQTILLGLPKDIYAAC